MGRDGLVSRRRRRWIGLQSSNPLGEPRAAGRKVRKLVKGSESRTEQDRIAGAALFPRCCERLFEVKLNARYHDFFEWLQIVNHELGYIVVKKFEINPNERDVLENPKLSLLLTLVSYRMEPRNAS